jgi:hemoglobin
MKETARNPLPRVPLPDQGIYNVLKEEGLTRLLKAVYRRLGKSPIREMFPTTDQDLDLAAEKSALFFIGICGGPPLFERRYGPPQMRARHQRFSITAEARTTWLSCWKEVLFEEPNSVGFPAEFRQGFWNYLEAFSVWMVNA